MGGLNAREIVIRDGMGRLNAKEMVTRLLILRQQ